MDSLLPLIDVGMSASIQGVTRITVEVETLMHQDRGTWPIALLCLVDWHVPIGLL